MPKLLIIDQAAPANLPNASPAAFGAGVGRAMQETGRVGQALGVVLQQYADTGAKKNAAMYEQELASSAQELSLDPDIAGRGAKFDSIQRKLQEKYRPKIGARSTYDAAAGMATQELRTRFDHKTMTDGIAESRLNTEINIGHKAMKAATAETDEEVTTLFQEIQNDLKEGSLYLTPAQQTQMFQSAMGNGLRAMADTNPKRALEWIDRVGTLLPPEVIAVYREEAMSNVRQQASLRVSDAQLDRKLRLQAEADASRDAEERMIEADASGSLSPRLVASEIENLSPAAYLRWSKRAKGDGGKTGSVNDPVLYMELTDRAEAGEDIRDEATAAVAMGAFSAEKRNALVKTSRDSRFKAPRTAINKALDPGMFKPDPEMAVKRVNTLQAFDEWVVDHPEASREEAMTKANELISLGKQRARASKFAGKVLKTTDEVRAQMALVVKQFRSGVIDKASYDEKIANLEQAKLEIERMEEDAGGQP